MNKQSDFESRSEDFEIQNGKSRRVFSSRRTVMTLCSVVFLVSLGIWSFTHQVSHGPPLENARAVVIQEIHALQVIPLNEEVIPKEGSVANWILGDGFAQAEEDGAWMTALNASINFSLDSQTKPPRSVTLTFLPLLGPTRPQRTLTVTSAGSSTTKKITGFDTMTVLLNGDLRQSISISCDSVDSANSLRVGPDFRPMCVKLVSVMVKSN